MPERYKKTPTSFDAEIKRVYNYSIYAIDNYLEHCKLMDELEDGSLVPYSNPAPLYENKKAFERYTLECKQFKELFLSPNNNLVYSVVTKGEQQVGEVKVMRLDPKQIDTHRAARKPSRIPKHLDLLISKLRPTYVGIKLIQFNLFQDKDELLSELVGRDLILYHLTCYLPRLYIG